MLSQWLWIMVCQAEPVVVNHVVLFWASDCEPWCIILSQWLWIMLCHFEPVVLNHVELCWASGCESWYTMLSPVVVYRDVLCWAKLLWIMMCYAETSGCESCCAMLNQWVWITMCYSEPVVVNHGVLFWANGCESCCVILSLWFWIMLSYAEPVVVNHGVLFWASGCESWYTMLSPVVVYRDVLCWAKLLWIMMCYAETSGW